MKRFAPILKDLNRKLDLPQPQKSRIILEIAYDLEEAYHAYRQQGLSSSEALAKAQEKFAANEASLAELVRIHQAPFKRWANQLSQRALRRWERITLLLILLLISAISARTILQTPFMQRTSPWVWPVLAIFTVIVALALAKFYQLYIKKDHKIHRLRKGLSLFLFLGLASLFLGILGYFVELVAGNHSSLMFETQLFFIISGHAPGIGLALHEALRWMLKTASLILISMFAAIVASLLWFVLFNKAVRIEQAEALTLLDG